MSITDATPEHVRQIMGDGKAEEAFMKAVQRGIDETYKLRAEVKRLRRALEDMEWWNERHGPLPDMRVVGHYCPICGGCKEEGGHKRGCYMDDTLHGKLEA